MAARPRQMIRVYKSNVYTEMKHVRTRLNEPRVFHRSAPSRLALNNARINGRRFCPHSYSRDLMGHYQ